jgi:kynurenine formamidase
MPMRRRVLAAGLAGVFGAALSGRTAQASEAAEATPPVRLDQLNLVNLSHVNDPATTNVFPGDPAFELETIATIPEDGYYLQFVREGEHTGTHWGAPGHFTTGEPLADDMDPADLFRPAVKIDVRAKAAANADYAVTVDDLKAWEKRHGRIPRGSVVMVRSDWSKRWTEDPQRAKALAADPNFPSVGLDALKFLHRKRHILFHGHEPLDTDSTPTLEGESWLMHHGYAQAEGVNNLGAVPATGCLVDIGYPKFAGGVGGYARFVAICPPSTKAGRRISGRDAPLRRRNAALHWSSRRGFRVR